MADTASIEQPEATAGPQATPQLIVALDGARPRTPSSRHLLAEIDSIAIGRGKRRRADRGRARQLELALDDATMSERHARVVRIHGQWIVEDAGSKNGTWLNGERVERARLGDGDVIALGQTLLVFRDAAAPIAGPPDLAATDLAPALPPFATFGAALAATAAALAQIAPTTTSVLLLGETGTGKEVASRAVHDASARRGPFVAVNCGALPANLVEAELFGHKRGAFSGAIEDRRGHVRTADGGTLLLDEIGDLPPAAQAALLRVVQERAVVPVGDSTPIAVDVRIIAATHVDLRAAIDDGEFRRDLHARLAGLTARLPPLAERREDLGLLIAALLARLGADTSITAAAGRALLAYDWPDNVRELEAALSTAIALAGGAAIDVPHLPAPVRDWTRGGAVAAPLSATDVALRAQLVAMLGEHRGNITAVARAMGKARYQVHRWLRRFQLEPETFR